MQVHFIRVGGSGGIGDGVHPGDVVISSGVVREERNDKSVYTISVSCGEPLRSGCGHGKGC